jgi:hypothetical protein
MKQPLDSLKNQTETVQLTKEQKQMLEMSETDLKKDETISQDELDKKDFASLKFK